MSVMAGAEPWATDGSREIGILVIHGFTGSPASTRPWGSALAECGWTVRVPRLPGHGTTWRDLNRTIWEDWYAAVDREFRALQRDCTSIFVMGLSVGGCLALRLAEVHGSAVTGLVVVNPSLHSERPDRFLLPVLRRFVPAFPGVVNDIAKPGQDEIGYRQLPLKAAYSLTRLWALVKRDIAEVDQPIAVLHSPQDHVVEPSNSAFVLANVSSSDITDVSLPDSFHVATLDYDAQLVFDTSIAFVRRVAADR